MVLNLCEYAALRQIGHQLLAAFIAVHTGIFSGQLIHFSLLVNVVKREPLAKPAIEAAHTGAVNFVPRITEIINFALLVHMFHFNIRNGRLTMGAPVYNIVALIDQALLEAQLKEEGTNRYEVGREEFLRRTWAWKEEYGTPSIVSGRVVAISILSVPSSVGYRK